MAARRKNRKRRGSESQSLVPVKGTELSVLAGNDPLRGLPPEDGEPRRAEPDEPTIDELLKTKGEDAFQRLVELALGKESKEIKPYLRVRCLIFLAEPWVHYSRKRLETAVDFKATLAEIARRAAEKYGRKGP